VKGSYIGAVHGGCGRPIYTYAYIHIYIYTYIHIYTYIYTHIYYAPPYVLGCI